MHTLLHPMLSALWHLPKSKMTMSNSNVAYNRHNLKRLKLLLEAKGIELNKVGPGPQASCQPLFLVGDLRYRTARQVFIHPSVQDCPR